MKISEICQTERPREKAISKGTKVLSNAELLAICLRTGSGNDSAIDLAHKLLKLSGGSIVRLSELPLESICSIPGIKENKAASVLTAIELGRRFCIEQSSGAMKPFVESSELYEVLIPHMKGLRREVCRIVLLNSARFFICSEEITSGGGSSTIIDIPAIIRSALENRASYVVLSHNHPSGDPRPSRADIKQTKALKDALNQVELILMDHIIVCDESWYSFADERAWMA